MAKKKAENKVKITALYCRLSVEETKDSKDKRKKKQEDESNSISNQKQILLDYAKQNGYLHTEFFVDDGVSGTTFDRPDFQRMQRMVENGEVGTIIVKDLSRFGRESIEMGRLTQVVYPSLGVTFISIQENVNSSTGTGLETMPFHNIFNEWYAEQTSKKIKAVWKAKADNGEHVAPVVPFGYMKISDDRFYRMSANYEKEQKELLAAVEHDEQKVREAEQEKINLNVFLTAIRECTDLKELTPTIVNTLIKRIDVHNSAKDEHGHKHVPIDIYFTAVGIINIPTEEELISAMEEMRDKPLKSA